MQYAWNAEGEGRNWRLELSPVFRSDLITAMHGADRCRQHCSTGVLELLSGLQQGLRANHAEPAHFLNLLIGVCDDPVTADQLCAHAAGIRDRNGVREYIAVLFFAGLVRHKRCFYRDGKFILFVRGHRVGTFQEIRPVVGELGDAE